MNFFAFRTRLYYIFLHNKNITICYAVVNLLNTQQQLSFLLIASLSLTGWWAQMDSDHRPHAYQACALTS